MNFRKPRPEEPEINLIPFIDVLLVILIFLMLSTTYSKFTELQITLPVADAEKARDRPREITPGWKPCRRSIDAAAITVGVLPAPPTMRLPTTMTGTGNRSLRSHPRR